MGYMDMVNLYKDQTILNFKEVWASEKVHGSSAFVLFTLQSEVVDVRFHAGGTKQATFEALFDIEGLKEKFRTLGYTKLKVHGEAHGGSMQGMKATYGNELRFVAFDLQSTIGETTIWMNMPEAEKVTNELGLEFVFYEKVSTDLASLDAARDRPSTQAIRRGIEEPKKTEGVVLRPIIEMQDMFGNRIIAKHKKSGEEFRETKSVRSVSTDPTKLAVLSEAEAISEEWVTPARLEHVLQGFDRDEFEMKDTPQVINAMLADVEKESVGEIVWSDEAKKAIKNRAAELFKSRVSKVVA